VTGKRRQKWHSGYTTKRAAERALTELLAAKDSGTYLEVTKQTFGGFIPEWLAAIKPTIRPSTHHSYRRNLQLHVLPHLDSVQLRRIDAGMLNGLYAALLADGRKNYADGGLSPRSVQYVHAIIHRALRDAVKWGRLARNPADAADPPKASRPESITWTAASCARSSSEPAEVVFGRRTSCLQQQDCGGEKRWGCAGKIWTSTVAEPPSDKP
jgi:Phage integrase, N-terminal SAM-like domain/Arm DNA-binding domain